MRYFNYTPNFAKLQQKMLQKCYFFVDIKKYKMYNVIKSCNNATKEKGGLSMVNVQRLKGLIVEKGTTQQAVADSIGIDRSTFYRKMKNGGSFSLEEAGLIAENVPLTGNEAMEIFFAGFVAKMQQN